VLNDLKSEGVDISMVQIGKGEKTGMSVVLVADDGGRSIITYRGAAKDMNSGEIDWGKISGADWIQIAALGGNMALVEDMVSFARKEKIPVGWNPGKGELVQKDRMLRILPKTEMLILNRMEAAQLVQHPYEEMKEMAVKISSFGVKKVVITDGKRGAGVMTEGVWISTPAFKTKSVDDTGAGDAFIAGMVAGFLVNKDLATSLKMGLANGASEVTSLGAKTGLLRKNEMTKWLRRRLKIIEEKV
ncbi:carbohydrate kinase family protein, partial [Candidatus Collierbacteria bacterium]|nr:carbohydrate kinase family protein [Candidatus Collierbacteria bacterium]